MNPVLSWRKELPQDLVREESSIVQRLQGSAHSPSEARSPRIHGFRADALVGSYTKLGSSDDDACSVFKSMPSRDDVVSWTSLIDSHTRAHDFSRALHVYESMLACGTTPPNRITFISALKACSGGRFLEQGMNIHASLAMRYGLFCDGGGDEAEEDVIVSTSLVNMYCKCGALEDALSVFDSMPRRNAATWNVLICGFRESGRMGTATEMYESMAEGGVKASRATYLSMLSVYGETGEVSRGEEIHAAILQDGLDGDAAVGSALVSMYGTCGALEEARHVFGRMKTRTIVTWTAMLGAYAKQGYHGKALETFEQMRRIERGWVGDEGLFASVVCACAGLGCVVKGRHVHACAVEDGACCCPRVANALVAMYGACGALEDAFHAFELAPRRVESWNALMSACARQGEEELAFLLYQEMLAGSAASSSSSSSLAVRPDELTYLILLGACASLPSLRGGEYFHACAVGDGFGGEARLGNTLVNMYGKCGDAHSAARAFQKLPSCCCCCDDDNVVGWTALIASYAQQGDAAAALRLAARMLLLLPDHRRAPEPSPVSFLAVLSACSHAGLVHDACSCFMLMCCGAMQNHRSTTQPATEHYVCLIDLLARAGRADEASAVAACSSLDSHLYASSALDRAQTGAIHSIHPWVSYDDPIQP